MSSRIFKPRHHERNLEEERSTEAFLNALSGPSIEKSENIYHLEREIKENGITPQIERQLEEKEHLMPSPKESIILQSIENNEFKSISDLSNHKIMNKLDHIHVEEVIQKGWVSQPSENEMEFLKEVSGADSRDKILIDQAQTRWGIKKRDLKKLQEKGHLSLPKPETIKAFYMVQKKLPSSYIHYITDASKRYQNILKSMDEEKIYKVKCKPKVLVQIPLPQNIKLWKLEKDREELKNLYSPLPKDNEILVKSQLKENDRLTSKDKKRLLELQSMGIELNQIHLPSTNDLKLFEKINSKKLTQEQIYKIGSEDLGMTKGHINGLINDHKYIDISPDKVKINWKDSERLSEIRSYYHTKKKLERKSQERILDTLFSNSIDKDVLSKIHESESSSDHTPIKRNVRDVKIYFKSLRNEDLDKFENFRLKQLNREGIHPEHEMSQDYFLQETKNQWRIGNELKKQRILTYEKKYGVNKEALKMINTFKQISHHTLLEMGLTENELLRYTEGLPKNKSLEQCKLLSKQVLETPKGPIPYYFIHHKGQVSGRRVLEQEIGGNNINKQPQKKQLFLFHDLKVVDSFLKVQKEIEKAGGKISHIKNESRQFSDNKKGLQNNERKNSPHFLDAQIILEEPIELQLDDKKISVKMVGVEYGNYSTERMREKLEKSEYDIAFVYSNKRHQIKYQNRIHINRPIHFRSI